jgi:hypothetical protein
MMASVLNPPPSKKFGKPAASILPLMARSFAADKSVEGILRPRMPVIRLGGGDLELEEENDEDEEMEEEEEEEQAEDEEPEALPQADDHFAGQELDNLLETAGESGSVTKDFAVGDAPTPSKPAESTPRSVRKGTLAQRPNISEPTAFSDTKRPIGEDGPLSPSKRARTGEDEQRATHPLPPTSEFAISSRDSTTDTTVPATSDFAATSTASVVPDLPEPGEGNLDEDDSDDDKISLVLGQDTDDDSD